MTGLRSIWSMRSAWSAARCDSATIAMVWAGFCSIVAVQMATTDELTRLANRRGLQAVGSNALALSRRFDKCAVLLYLDLDDFKQVNDNFGHGEGDRALKELRLLPAALRVQAQPSVLRSRRQDRWDRPAARCIVDAPRTGAPPPPVGGSRAARSLGGR